MYQKSRPLSKNLCIRGLPFDATALEFIGFVQQSRTCAAIFEDAPPRAAITSFIAGKSPNALKERSAVNSTVFIIAEDNFVAEQIAAALDGIALRPTTEPNILMCVEYAPSQEPPVGAVGAVGSCDTISAGQAGSVYRNSVYLEFVAGLVSAASAGSVASSSQNTAKASELNGGQTLEAWLQNEKQRDEEKKQTLLVRAMIDKWYHKIPLAWEVRRQKAGYGPPTPLVSSSSSVQTTSKRDRKASTSKKLKGDGGKVDKATAQGKRDASQRKHEKKSKNSHRDSVEVSKKPKKDAKKPGDDDEARQRKAATKRSKEEQRAAKKKDAAKVKQKTDQPSTKQTDDSAATTTSSKSSKRRDETSKERRERKRRSEAAKRAANNSEASRDYSSGGLSTPPTPVAEGEGHSSSSSSSRGTGSRGSKKHNSNNRDRNETPPSASGGTKSAAEPAERAEKRERLRRRMEVALIANEQRLSKLPVPPRGDGSTAPETGNSASATKNVFTVTSTRRVQQRAPSGATHVDPDAAAPASISIPRPRTILRPQQPTADAAPQ